MQGQLFFQSFISINWLHSFGEKILRWYQCVQCFSYFSISFNRCLSIDVYLQIYRSRLISIPVGSRLKVVLPIMKLPNTSFLTVLMILVCYLFSIPSIPWLLRKFKWITFLRYFSYLLSVMPSWFLISSVLLLTCYLFVPLSFYFQMLISNSTLRTPLASF